MLLCGRCCIAKSSVYDLSLVMTIILYIEWYISYDNNNILEKHGDEAGDRNIQIKTVSPTNIWINFIFPWFFCIYVRGLLIF